MSITIQIRRVISPRKRQIAAPLLDQVRDLTRYQNGHLYTEVLSPPEVSEISIENSTWSSMMAWKTWESSRDWQTAKARIEKLLDAKTECAVVDAAVR
jgi:antibiotic biosynthesis monooxygenase (ABM) superfamily enzyme